MKRYQIYPVLIAFFVVIASSCKKDFLDKEPDEDMTLEEVFAERQYAERWLTSAYFNLPEEISFNDWWGRNPFVGAADEMEITWTYPFAHQMTAGAWNPTNVEENIWRFNWEGIRKVSIFLDNIHRTPMAEADKNVWIGEATFLRAFFHFWQMRAHGPIPIVDRSYTAEDDYTQIKRMPIDQCVAFIAAQCDAAAALLPVTLTSDKYGRPTKAAALALKARALLYMASPLWNGNPDYRNFLGAEGERLFPDYNEARWQVAADAAKACLDEANSSGIQLYRAANGDPVRSYQELFLNRFNSEVLFARLLANWDHQERATSPNGMGGWSGYCPSQELIDAYQMADGSTPITGYNGEGLPIVNTASGYEEAGYAMGAHPKGYHLDAIRNMYVGREPRFYASINFSGSYWRGRRIEFWNTGLDGRAKGGPDYTATGYLMKKFSDETVNIPQGRFTHKTWIYFRLGEQYLNYAEALNEAQGPVADVYDHVNAIRNRAGLPNLESGLSKDEMREKIRHERRIELAFETHRYFDTRRWKIAEITDNKDFYRLNIGEGTSLQDDAFYQRVFLKKRVFDKARHYLWPIPQSEINRTPTIVQNPNW